MPTINDEKILKKIGADLKKQANEIKRLNTSENCQNFIFHFYNSKINKILFMIISKSEFFNVSYSPELHMDLHKIITTNKSDDCFLIGYEYLETLSDLIYICGSNSVYNKIPNSIEIMEGGLIVNNGYDSQAYKLLNNINIFQLILSSSNKSFIESVFGGLLNTDSRLVLNSTRTSDIFEIIKNVDYSHGRFIIKELNTPIILFSNHLPSKPTMMVINYVNRESENVMDVTLFKRMKGFYCITSYNYLSYFEKIQTNTVFNMSNVEEDDLV